VPGNMDPREFAQNFAFNIKPGSLLNTTRAQRAQILLMLRRMGEVDRNNLLEAFELGPMIPSINKNLHEEGKDLLLQLVKAKAQKQGGIGNTAANALEGDAGGGVPA